MMMPCSVNPLCGIQPCNVTPCGIQPLSCGAQPFCNGIQPPCNGIQPPFNGIQTPCKGIQPQAPIIVCGNNQDNPFQNEQDENDRFFEEQPIFEFTEPTPTPTPTPPPPPPPPLPPLRNCLPLERQLFSTGVDNNGRSLPSGTIDPHYKLTLRGNNIVSEEVRTINPNVAWIPNKENSSWVGFESEETPGGNYGITTTFNLCGEVDSTGIVFEYTVDNKMMDVLLNGISTGIRFEDINTYDKWSPKYFIDEGFIAGENKIEFIWNNLLTPDYPAGPAGVQIQLHSKPPSVTVSSSNPLPWIGNL
jgi:hypothetical protein